MRPAALVFDLFGTLLDISSLRVAATEVTSDPDPFVATWREKQIGYAFASAIMERHEDFDAITGHALSFAAARHRVVLAAEARRRLVRAWETMRPYPDAVPALRALRERAVPCAVLTNGTPATAAAAIANAELGPLLDVTLSVESAGVYKPDRRVYALATAHYGVPPDRLLFITSNGWDATGAAAFGLRVAWCNRVGAPAETFGPPPNAVIGELGALVELVDAA